MSTIARELQTKYRRIPSYEGSENIDPHTVSSFGEEWTSFHGFSEKDILALGEQYFDIVHPGILNDQSTVVDIGCGSGRFIKYMRAKYPLQSITGIDPSSAILAADALIGVDEKVNLVQAAADNIPFPDGHFDFGYSLGVLHHIPDTAKALNDCVKKVKQDGHFLVYLYYNLDNKPYYFKIIFFLSNLIRRVVSRMPAGLKKVFCAFLTIVLYMPFVLLCRFLRLLGVPKRIRQNIPLQVYENQSFYIIRNDSLDRFGTPLEQRFSRKQIQAMMEQAGLYDIVFSEKTPYWHAIGRKK
ncbi:MAG: class I SAM-dependent methyltransferase [Chitinophagaceae bacterium]